MARNWIGVRASAIIAILGSAATLLFAGLMLLMAFVPQSVSAPPTPIPLKPLGITMAAFFLAVSAWGFSTGIGIILRRRWSRISILVFAAILAFMSASGLLMAFVMPIPAPPGADPAIPGIVRWVMAGFYGVLAVISVWWLVLFNRTLTKSYFHGAGQESDGGRPLSISVIAWYLLSVLIFYVPVMLIHPPAVLFGMVFSNWISLALFTAFLLVQTFIGVGLLRLRESARIAAIAYFCFLGVNAFTSMRPATQAEMMQRMQHSMPRLFPAGTEVSPFPSLWPIGLATLVLTVLPIFFLVRQRAVFSHLPEQSAR